SAWSLCGYSLNTFTAQETSRTYTFWPLFGHRSSSDYGMERYYPHPVFLSGYRMVGYYPHPVHHALTQAQCGRSHTSAFEKQSPQRYTAVGRLMTERIAYNGTQKKPDQQESHANQGKERAEPEEEFYHGKNVIEECENQALYSFALG